MLPSRIFISPVLLEQQKQDQADLAVDLSCQVARVSVVERTYSSLGIVQLFDSGAVKPVMGLLGVEVIYTTLHILSFIC